MVFGGVTPIFCVGNLQASVAYYVDVLGFKADWEHKGVIASVSRDRCGIFLCEGDQGHSGGWVWVGVDDVERLFEEYRAKGAKIRQPPTSFPWALEIQVEDPDGNVLRFGSEPKADQPFGPWLDMHGDLWESLPKGGWKKVEPGPGLRETLAAALQRTPPPAAPDYALALLLDDAKNGRLDPADPTRFLLDRLRGDPSLEIFHGRMQVLPGVSVRVDDVGLALWLLRRAAAVGPGQAVSDLERYLGTDRLVHRLTLAVGGIKASRRYSFSRGIQLIPWEDMPDSITKRAINERSLHWGFHYPEVALVREVELPRTHAAFSESNEHMSPLDSTEITDLILCLGLFGPVAPVHLATWLEPPEWAPVMSSGYSMPLVEGLGFRPVDEAALTEAITLFANWLSLSEPRKAELRLPMQRLTSATRRSNPVDSAVDLGIALESIFLRDHKDERTELTFRLRVRASRWLGSTSDERSSISALLADLYEARSQAVHRGRIPPAIRKKATTQLLEKGYRLTADALVRLITEGEPNWDAVTLG